MFIKVTSATVGEVRVNINHIVWYHALLDDSGTSIVFNNSENDIAVTETAEQIDQLIYSARMDQERMTATVRRQEKML